VNDLVFSWFGFCSWILAVFAGPPGEENGRFRGVIAVRGKLSRSGKLEVPFICS
jgi:hypothetical protein